MNDENKFAMACKIMDGMVAKYSTGESLCSNATLDIMFKIREKVNQHDEVIIDRVIELYGPVIKKENAKNKKLSKFTLRGLVEKCKNWGKAWQEKHAVANEQVSHGL